MTAKNTTVARLDLTSTLPGRQEILIVTLLTWVTAFGTSKKHDPRCNSASFQLHRTKNFFKSPLLEGMFPQKLSKIKVVSDPKEQEEGRVGHRFPVSDHLGSERLEQFEHEKNGNKDPFRTLLTAS